MLEQISLRFLENREVGSKAAENYVAEFLFESGKVYEITPMGTIQF